MNQRILLPAIIIGGLFAVALGFVRGLLPDATDAVLFAVDAGFLIVAVLVYGVLMREAAAAAATSSPAARAGKQRNAGGNAARGGRGRRGGERGGERSGQRGGEGGRGGRGRGGRGGERGGERGGREKKAAREERPAAPAGPREDGEIKWFSGAKGYGFIIRPNGDEIFVHHRALRDKSRREIPDGTPVSYVVADRDKGPQADDVEVTGAQPAENAA